MRINFIKCTKCDLNTPSPDGMQLVLEIDNMHIWRKSVIGWCPKCKMYVSTTPHILTDHLLRDKLEYKSKMLTLSNKLFLSTHDKQQVRYWKTAIAENVNELDILKRRDMVPTCTICGYKNPNVLSPDSVI